MKKILKYLLIISTIVGLISCQRNKEEDLYKTALEDLKNGNTKSAIDNLEKLIEINPLSDFAPDAYFTLAGLYQSIEGDSIQIIENYRKALGYYQQLIDNFPNHPRAPEAVFMCGFICAEYLKDYNQASIFYKKFLKAYPDHELVTSVQAELDNLGKSPEEILREKGVQLGMKGDRK